MDKKEVNELKDLIRQVVKDNVKASIKEAVSKTLEPVMTSLVAINSNIHAVHEQAVAHNKALENVLGALASSTSVLKAMSKRIEVIAGDDISISGPDTIKVDIPPKGDKGNG